MKGTNSENDITFIFTKSYSTAQEQHSNGNTLEYVGVFWNIDYYPYQTSEQVFFIFVFPAFSTPRAM